MTSNTAGPLVICDQTVSTELVGTWLLLDGTGAVEPWPLQIGDHTYVEVSPSCDEGGRVMIVFGAEHIALRPVAFAADDGPVLFELDAESAGFTELSITRPAGTTSHLSIHVEA